MLTLASEHSSSEDNFERKFQAKLSLHNQVFEKNRRIIDRVQGKTTNGTKQVIIRTHWKWSAYSQLWNFIFLRLLWYQTPGQVWKIWSSFWTTRRIVYGFHGTTASKFETDWKINCSSQFRRTVYLRSY